MKTHQAIHTSQPWASPPAPRPSRYRLTPAPLAALTPASLSLPATHNVQKSPSIRPAIPTTRPSTPISSLSSLTLSPIEPHPPSPPASPPLTPLQRLEELQNTITDVLRSYSVLPTRSPIYLAALHEFHARAAALHPCGWGPAKSSTGSPSPMLREAQRSLSPHARTTRQESYSSPGYSRGVPISSPSPYAVAECPHGSRSLTCVGAQGPLPSAEQVDTLEKDWWSSEVVAAWYGPRTIPRSARRGRGVGQGSASRRGKNEVESLMKAEMLKRGASYVGLYDE